MKRYIKATCILVISTILIFGVACGKKDKVDNNKDDFSGNITILTDSRYEQALKISSENFKKIHPKVEITLKSENIDNANVSNKLKDKNNQVDIINLENMYIESFLNKDIDNIVDVTNDISSYKDKFIKNKMENVTVKNKIYGFPWSTSPKMMVYRKDIFSKENINPEDIKTWGDLIEVSKKISYDTGKKIMPNITNDYNDIRFLLPNQLGVSFINKDGKMDFLSNEWIRTGEMFKALYVNNIFFDVEGEGSVMDLAISDNIVSFIADPKMIKNFTSVTKESRDKWGIMKLPAFETGGNRDVSLGGSTLMINKNSKNQSIAKEFTKFVATDENNIIQYLNKTGVFPTFIDIYNLTEFNKNDEYFNSRVLFMFSNVEKSANGTNYTKSFPEIKNLYKGIFNIETLKDRDVKTELDLIQKESIKKISEIPQ